MPEEESLVAEPYSKSGSMSREINRRIDRPCPGTRSMNPLASNVSTIWCTEGGDTLEYFCMSDSAGAHPLIFA